jgi:thioredoxin reductase (NADPH)
VVGAGNSAGQAALHLARFARSVTMLVRGDALAATMSEYLVSAITASPEVRVLVRTEVVDGAGSAGLESVTVRERDGGTTRQLPAAALFVLIGAEPRTSWLAGTVALDDRGYVRTGPDLLTTESAPRWRLPRPPMLLETSLPGVFAAGDVRSRSIKRVAAAAGEGATAVSLVHEYLAARGS